MHATYYIPIVQTTTVNKTLLILINGGHYNLRVFCIKQQIY